MKVIIILFFTILAQGKATHYDCGVMDQVVKNRQRWGQIDTSQFNVGYVAMADCSLLNERVYVLLPDGKIIGPLLVTDCGAEEHQAHLEEIGFAVDLSWDLAVQLDSVGTPIHGVTIFKFNWETLK